MIQITFWIIYHAFCPHLHSKLSTYHACLCCLFVLRARQGKRGKYTLLTTPLIIKYLVGVWYSFLVLAPSISAGPSNTQNRWCDPNYIPKISLCSFSHPSPKPCFTQYVVWLWLWRMVMVMLYGSGFWYSFLGPQRHPSCGPPNAAGRGAGGNGRGGQWVRGGLRPPARGHRPMRGANPPAWWRWGERSSWRTIGPWPKVPIRDWHQ